ncbi:MAG: hypothetical protein OHK93_008474 [Ramalina farinacea]|uniref:Uncharacterized protein n=1 Tax=Ramalina farinacea TaxID=258253 RepID=A0AA43TRX6_9LECA|nr:hypothetical protein [Ramalina farinacea]
MDSQSLLIAKAAGRQSTRVAMASGEALTEARNDSGSTVDSSGDGESQDFAESRGRQCVDFDSSEDSEWGDSAPSKKRQRLESKSCATKIPATLKSEEARCEEDTQRCETSISRAPAKAAGRQSTRVAMATGDSFPSKKRQRLESNPSTSKASIIKQSKKRDVKRTSNVVRHQSQKTNEGRRASS